jgi:hypothetical protein
MEFGSSEILIGVACTILGGVGMLVITRFFEQYWKQKEEQGKRIERLFVRQEAMFTTLRVVLNGKGDGWSERCEEEYQRLLKDRNLQ